MFVCTVETPHCSDKNGAEGPLIVHPTSNVLDPLWPKGKIKPLFLLKGIIMCWQRKLNSTSLFKGSRWTLQATTMDGNFVSLVIKTNYKYYIIIILNMFSCSNNFFVSAGYNCYTAWSDAGQSEEFYHVSLNWCTALYLRKKFTVQFIFFERLSTPSWSWLWCLSWTA